jgi:hypothetical protein
LTYANTIRFGRDFTSLSDRGLHAARKAMQKCSLRLGLQAVAAKAMSAKTVAAKAMTAKTVAAKAMSAKAMTAIDDLHMSFPFLISRQWPIRGWQEFLTFVKKDAMQALSRKSRKKGSKKRTCPKADMPKSR